MNIKLSDHFTCSKLMRYTLPAIAMTLFSSLYGIMDGFFVSNFAGKTSFAAVSLILPYVSAMSAFGYMLGSGGAALVAKTLGEKDPKRANGLFSLLVLSTFILGEILSIPGLIFLRPAAAAMGADGKLLEECVLYGGIMITCQSAFMLQTVFQSMFAVAEKPALGLILTVAAGFTDMLLNALFVIVFHRGVAGAALSSVLGQLVGSLIPILYFLRPNTSLLRLTVPVFDMKALLKACSNGLSETVTLLCSSVVGFLYDYRLMHLAGEDGIAAYGVILYANVIVYGVFMGFSTGSSPVVSYHFGAQNREELKSLCKKSLTLVGIASLVLTGASILGSRLIAGFFVGYDPRLLQMSIRAYSLYSISFLLCGFNIWGSGFFTALNNGVVSALISFGRTFLFQTLAVMILPLLMGLDGIWLSMTAAEAMAFGSTVFFLMKNRKRYGYA